MMDGQLTDKWELAGRDGSSVRPVRLLTATTRPVEQPVESRSRPVDQAQPNDDLMFRLICPLISCAQFNLFQRAR